MQARTGISCGRKNTVMTSAAHHREALAYVATAQAGCTSAIVTVDLDEASPTFGTVIHRADLPPPVQQWRDLSWQASSPERRDTSRTLVAFGLSSDVRYELDTAQDPRAPRLIRINTADTGTAAATSADGAAARHDNDTTDPAAGRRVVTGDWGPTVLVRRELDLEALVAGAYGHRLQVRDSQSLELMQAIDLGVEHQLVMAVCPATQQRRVYGFAAAMTSTVDWSGSVWLWHRAAQDGACVWVARKVITIPAEVAADADPPALLPDSQVIPPLVSHVALSPDDRLLYVCCWGTGELRQYDVCDPFHPVLMARVRLGGIARRHPHPRHPRRTLRGGPRMARISQDGRRLYVTSALHSDWDRQFHHGGVDGWLARCLADPNGGLVVDPAVFVDFGRDTPQHVLLEERTWNASETRCCASGNS